MPHALIFTLSLVAQAPAEPFAGKAVADGDTNTVLRDRLPVKIRLHGVDAPEAGQLFGPPRCIRVAPVAGGITSRRGEAEYRLELAAIQHPPHAVKARLRRHAISSWGSTDQSNQVDIFRWPGPNSSTEHGVA